MLPVLKANGKPAVSRFFDEDFDKLFQFTGNQQLATPQVNIKETESEYVIELAAPGKNKEDFQIELNKNMLTISSEVKNESEQSEDNYRRKEFNYESFSRSFNLKRGVFNQDEISAKYENGILFVSVPKSEEAKEKPVRKIDIS